VDFARTTYRSFYHDKGENCTLAWDLVDDDATGQRVLKAQYRLTPAANDANTAWLSSTALRQDWSQDRGIYLTFQGDGKGTEFIFEVFDQTGGKREHFESRFTDSTPGWRTICVPFASFRRRETFQEPDAPNDGFNRDRIAGWSVIALANDHTPISGTFTIGEIGAIR